MKIDQLLGKLQKTTTQPRPYVNHSVTFKKPSTQEERTKKLEEVGWNIFRFPAELISGCDFLSDSGTSTMTDEQWELYI